MTWTFDPAIATDVDRLRLELGDIDADDPGPLQDETLDYLLSEAGGSIRVGLYLALRALVHYYSDQADKTVGSLSISYSQKAQNYAQRLKDAAAGLPAQPYAGGISATDKEIRESSGDGTAPFFTRKTHDALLSPDHRNNGL